MLISLPLKFASVDVNHYQLMNVQDIFQMVMLVIPMEIPELMMNGVDLIVLMLPTEFIPPVTLELETYMLLVDVTVTEPQYQMKKKVVKKNNNPKKSKKRNKLIVPALLVLIYQNQNVIS